jgi:hypothetical protein
VQRFGYQAKRRGRSLKATRKPPEEDNATVVKSLRERSNQTVDGHPENNNLNLPRLVRMQSSLGKTVSKSTGWRQSLLFFMAW